MSVIISCTVIIHVFAGTGSGLHCWQILIFFLCLRVKFHKSLFWVPILAAGGPYWVLISQKVGSLFQSMGVLISLADSNVLVWIPSEGQMTKLMDSLSSSDDRIGGFPQQIGC